MKTFFGWLLIVIGVLIAGTAGLCSAGMLLSPSSDPMNAAEALKSLPVVAIFGGLPFLFGVVCIIGGWVIRKDK